MSNPNEPQPIWPGMPDPHRHNPFAVGLVLVVLALIAWALIAAVVLALIAGIF